MRRVLRATGVVAGLTLACALVGHRRTERSTGSDWLTRAQQQIAAREYRASENGEGLQAPNRAHNLRTYFTPTGIRVHDRVAASSPELLRLSLTGVGRGDSLAAFTPGADVVAQDRRVEIRRPGLVEWYVNSEAGLEQGFTIEERPAGDGVLAVEIAFTGARASRRGDGVIFQTASQRKLAYEKLVAVDAEQRALPARLEIASAERLRIVVDDAGASYPVVIDPLLTESADTQIEGNQSGAALGTSVAGAGDVNGDGYADVIVGAPGYDSGQSDEGAAFLFLGSPSGIPDGIARDAVTQLESNEGGAQMGISVAAAGDVNGDGYADVIVGALYFDSGQTDEGVAFVFRGGANGIANGGPALAALRLEANQSGSNFGTSVAGAGDVNGDGYADMIVGADRYFSGETGEGAAFLFLGRTIRDPVFPLPAARLDGNRTTASFGTSVAGAGDVNGDGYADVIVGAPSYKPDLVNEGAAFVFHGSATGIANGATALAQLESNQADARFGYRVAAAGDVNGDGYGDVIVGAPNYDDGQMDEGAGFVFTGGSGGIGDGDPATAAAALTSDQAYAYFGVSVASAGDVNGDGYPDVIVGAPSYDDGQVEEGAAFVFCGGATGVEDGGPDSALAQLEADTGGTYLGRSVASVGDVDGDGFADVIVGGDGYPNGGVALLFLGGGAGIPDGNPESANARLVFADSIAGAGDVNGDGYSDVIIGVQDYDAGRGTGAAFVYLGSASGIADGSAGSAATHLDSDQAYAYFGAGVASAGDVNGDGYGDVIVGADWYDHGEEEEGAAFIFLGSSTGIASGTLDAAATRLESDQEADGEFPPLLPPHFGRSVAAAGDVNGDGYGDVIVGAPYYDAGQENEGAAFVFLGSASGIANGSPATAVAQLESNQAGAEFGISVAGAGDVDANGFSDVIVGAWRYRSYADPGTRGQAVQGAAFVFHGFGGITSRTPEDPRTTSILSEGYGYESSFGWSVAGAGDVDGDGWDDVIVGAPDYRASGPESITQEGGAFVYFGSNSGVDPTYSDRLASHQDSSQFGWSVAGAGDVNGDGYADVIVGAPGSDGGQNLEGMAFVFLGNYSGVQGGNPATASAQLEANAEGAQLGEFVAGAGDVNGDGFADVITGSPFTVTLLFHGNGGGDGRPVLAQQRRGDGSGIPVQPWGLSYSDTGFEAGMMASHPEGRGRIRVEFERICTVYLPGEGEYHYCGTGMSDWVSVGPAVPEVQVTHRFTGGKRELYRWRARVQYAPATGAIGANPAHGPWRHLGAQSVEGVRVLPEPTLALSLACGMGLLAGLRRRNRSLVR